MIQEEYLKEGKLVRHYSDSGMMILQNETGVTYSDAVDVVPCRYTYTETDTKIDKKNTVRMSEATIQRYKRLYLNGKISDDALRRLVDAGKMTEDEYNEITGEAWAGN